MTKINREQFEAWLFAQPNNRTFNYREGKSTDLVGCIICNFLREQTGVKNFKVGGHRLGIITPTDVIPFTQWTSLFLLAALMAGDYDQSKHTTVITGLQAKTAYTTLFGSPVPVSQEQTQPTSKVPETPVLESTHQ